MNTELIGLIAGALTSVAMMPQLIKVIKDKNAQDISMLTILVLITGISLWVWYGFLNDELPIILSNAFAVLVNIALLICSFIYKKKN